MDKPHLCLPTLKWALQVMMEAEPGRPSAFVELQDIIEAEERTRERAREVYHFGCWSNRHSDPGHFTHGENGRHLSFNKIGPWTNLDGKLAPGGRYKDVEGATALHYYLVNPGTPEGSTTVWTAIAFWDRSGDKRGASNTGFFVARKCSFQEMCDLAEERYPAQWKRLNVRPFLVKTFDEGWSEVYANKDSA